MWLTWELSNNRAIARPAGLLQCVKNETGAKALISKTFWLYSGRADAMTQNAVVPCEWPM